MEGPTPFVLAQTISKSIRKKMGKVDKKKALSYGIGILLSLIGLGAVICGIWLMVVPDGSGLGMSVDILKNSPFKDFLIPGIILFAINGVASLIGALLSFRRHRYAWGTTMFLGAAMIIWISAEIYWMGWESWLQTTFLVVGLLEMFLGFFLYEVNRGDHGMSRGNKNLHAH